jgi:hypothetical protein
MSPTLILIHHSTHQGVADDDYYSDAYSTDGDNTSIYYSDTAEKIALEEIYGRILPKPLKAVKKRVAAATFSTESYMFTASSSSGGGVGGGGGGGGGDGGGDTSAGVSHSFSAGSSFRLLLSMVVLSIAVGMCVNVKGVC